MNKYYQILSAKSIPPAWMKEGRMRRWGDWVRKRKGIKKPGKLR
jgi:hypothetical protein